MTGLLQVTTVYGDRCYVLASDYEKARHMVPLVTRQGVRFSDRKSYKPGDCTMIARDNVASVKPLPMKAPCPYQAAAFADGWEIGPHGKWYNRRRANGATYVNTPRAFRYICEDHKLGPFS
jgi:hypothetical protein